MKLIKRIILPIICVFPDGAFATEELSTKQLVIQAEIKRAGDFMGFGFDSLWMMSRRRLVRVNVADNSVIDIELAAPGRYRAMAVGEGAVWVPATSLDKILKIDPTSNKLIQEIPAKMLASEGSIGVGEGGVWVLTETEAGDADLTRFNSTTGAIDARIALPGNSAGVVVDFGSVWVTGYSNGELYRIDPKSNSIVSTIKLHANPRFIASGENSIWVLNQSDGTVQRIDGKTGELQATIETHRRGSGGDIVCGGGYVWITMPGTPVGQIDPKTNTLVRVFRGSMGDAIRYGGGSLWVSGSAIHRIEPPK